MWKTSVPKRWVLENMFPAFQQVTKFNKLSTRNKLKAYRNPSHWACSQTPFCILVTKLALGLTPFWQQFNYRAVYTGDLTVLPGVNTFPFLKISPASLETAGLAPLPQMLKFTPMTVGLESDALRASRSGPLLSRVTLLKNEQTRKRNKIT